MKKSGSQGWSRRCCYSHPHPGAVAAVTRTIGSGALSAWLQAFGLVHRRRLGIREKVDKRLCRDRLL